jgi:hypothetical protein
MSTLTLPTRGLVGLLEDLRLTAGKDPELPFLASVLLHSDRGDWEMPVDDKDEDADTTEPLIEVIETNLLVATSTSGKMLGQGHTWCDGNLARPILVAAKDVKAILDVFKPLVTSLSKATIHRTVLTLSGEMLRVSEDPKQVPRGKSVVLTTLDLNDYPRNIAPLLDPETGTEHKRDGKVIPRSYGTGINYDHLAIIGKIAKRRRMPIAWYEEHQNKGIVITIGSAYRAVFQPLTLDEENEQHLEPQVDVFDPPLPERKTPVEALPEAV